MKVYDIILSKYKRYTCEVVNQIKAFPKDLRLSGDCSKLNGIWDEMRFQMQTGEEAVAFDLYEETVRICCRGLVESLPRDEQALLWLWSDDFYETWDDQKHHAIPYGDPLIDAVTEELCERVWHAAEIEKLPDKLLDSE